MIECLRESFFTNKNEIQHDKEIGQPAMLHVDGSTGHTYTDVFEVIHRRRIDADSVSEKDHQKIRLWKH